MPLLDVAALKFFVLLHQFLRLFFSIGANPHVHRIRGFSNAVQGFGIALLDLSKAILRACLKGDGSAPEALEGGSRT